MRKDEKTLELSSLLLLQPSTLSISACLALSSVEPIKVDDSVTHH